MWIYIVTWLVVTNYVTGPKIVPDEYGVISNMVNAVAVMHSDKKEMKKEFPTKQEAQEFIDNCPYKSMKDYYEFGSYCIRFKLDSAFVKPDSLKKGEKNE